MLNFGKMRGRIHNSFQKDFSLAAERALFFKELPE